MPLQIEIVSVDDRFVKPSFVHRYGDVARYRGLVEDGKGGFHLEQLLHAMVAVSFALNGKGPDSTDLLRMNIQRHENYIKKLVDSGAASVSALDYQVARAQAACAYSG